MMPKNEEWEPRGGGNKGEKVDSRELMGSYAAPTKNFLLLDPVMRNWDSNKGYGVE